MSFAEILAELPQLTDQERQALLEQLQLQKEEDEAIEVGLCSLEEEPTISWTELRAEMKSKYGWE
jgi:hypothetical protein